MQAPQLSPLTGDVASRGKRHLRNSLTQLTARRLNLSAGRDNLAMVTPIGHVDVPATLVLLTQHNEAQDTIQDEEEIHQITVIGAAKVDEAVGSMALDIMNASNVPDWRWESTNGLDHAPSIRAHATRTFFMMVRFGALFWEEIYTLCGQSCGEKNCQKGVQRLVEQGFLDDRRKVGRKHLVFLTPRFCHAIPAAGIRKHWDESAFQTEIEVGRAMIQARRDARL
jgi:hypothetical protein